VQDADRPETHLTVKKIFVSGVKDEIEADDLREYFSEMGNITDVDVIMDKETKRKRGFAFVQFDDYDPVDKAVCKYFLLPFFLLQVLLVSVNFFFFTSVL